MIQFDHVSKLYYGHPALDNISVDIQDGEFVFLIGPSGAGKTTLLRLLIGDTQPTRGTLRIDETDVKDIPVKKIYLLRRKVGMVFQDFKLLIDRTVFENVAITLEILGKDEAFIRKQVSEILALVGLEKKMNHFPVQLSAGESQRASIARAIVGGLKILLADEPTGNLDPETSWEILDILSEINRIGTTVIMATHNAFIVDDMKKRTLTLTDGELIHDDVHGKYRVSPRHEQQKERKQHGQ